jgi:pimeloyl-ACP methyl ester carboxylesterase
MTSSDGSQGGVQAPIVFVHGDFADGMESWGSVATAIGGRARSIVVDRPGFYPEDVGDEAFTIAGDADYLLSALAEMGLSSFHLVGHSYGGLVAVEIAATRPTLVRSLHLLEPPWLALLPDDPPVRELDEQVRAIQLAHRDGEDTTTTEAFFTAMGAGHTVERLRGTPEWDRLSSHASRFARTEPANTYPPTRLDQLDDKIPVALYTGGRSHPGLRSIVAALGNRIGRAQLVDVPGAGHAVQMSGQPFIEPLISFVSDADAAWQGQG